jgi:hypothetical protein
MSRYKEGLARVDMPAYAARIRMRCHEASSVITIAEHPSDQGFSVDTNNPPPASRSTIRGQALRPHTIAAASLAGELLAAQHKASTPSQAVFRHPESIAETGWDHPYIIRSAASAPTTVSERSKPRVVLIQVGSLDSDEQIGRY